LVSDSSLINAARRADSAYLASSKTPKDSLFYEAYVTFDTIVSTAGYAPVMLRGKGYGTAPAMLKTDTTALKATARGIYVISFGASNLVGDSTGSITGLRVVTTGGDTIWGPSGSFLGTGANVQHSVPVLMAINDYVWLEVTVASGTWALYTNRGRNGIYLKLALLKAL
jgi:hypothetical protein